jgi:uncharacterized protein YqeY
MTLIADIETELKKARLARDVERRDALALLLSSLRSAQKELQRELSEDEALQVLRLILASLQGAEKELQRELHADEELQVLQRERKKRAEAMEAYDAAGREEQADREEFELDVIEEFMPEPLSEDDLEEIVDNVIAEVGATSIRDLGRVMADVMPQVSGRADGSTVSQLVREKLA